MTTGTDRNVSEPAVVVRPAAEQNVPAQQLFAHAGFRRPMIEMTRELLPAAEDWSSNWGRVLR